MQCRCGGSLTAEESQVNQSRKCDACGALLTCVCAEALPGGAGAADFDAGLWVTCRPSLQMIAWRLGGCETIHVGSLPEQNIHLNGAFVSGSHCQLVRVDFGPSRWRMEDLGSENGVFVNGERITQRELRHGDAIQVGDFELVYEVDSERPVVVRQAPKVREQPPALTITCPSCDRSMRAGARICVPCGIYLDTGRPLLTSQVDENAVHATAEPLVKVASFLVPFTLLPIPIAADGRGKYRPYAVWAIAAITALVSLMFFIEGFSDDSAMNNLMLWPTSSDGSPGQFHAYQLITDTLIHDRGSITGFLLHLGGNMLFLLVFGTRVNSLIGNIATAIVYPLLAIASGLMYLAMLPPGHLAPALGASGAINGLAGMYLVLLPGHKVYCAMWIRIISFTLFRMYFAMKIFAIRGFWVLLIYFGYDVLMVGIGWQDGTAHWAHIGGFLAGAAIGMALLLSKQFNCHNGDLLSVLLGKHAWRVIGKPSRWNVSQPG
jgi:membrane associated rhomboid family serine protease